MNRAALPYPRTFVSFSPLRGSGRKPSYPSQELNLRLHVNTRSHTSGDSRLNRRSSFHEEVDNDRKLSPTVPVPPLPPLPNHFHLSPQIKVEDVTVTSCNVARMMYRDGAIVESNEQDLNLNHTHPFPPSTKKDSPRNEVDTSMLDDFVFDHNDILSVDMMDSIHDDVASLPVENLLDLDPLVPQISNQQVEIEAVVKPPNNNKMKKSTTGSRSKKKRTRKPQKSNQCLHSKNSYEADAPAVGIERPNDMDVLRGRGGLTNRHMGNMRFRDEARKLRVAYRDQATSRREKYLLSKVCAFAI